VTPKGDIRSNESHQREQRAKAIAHDLLLKRSFLVSSTDRRGNRHVLSALDPAGIPRVLWFKLGWNPEAHGTSAVQITMLKARTDEEPPAQWSSGKVLAAVRDKARRAASAGVTDMLLFSLERDNETPLAALLLPIAQVEAAFRDALMHDESLARKGASPSLWLLGKTPSQMALAGRLRRFCDADLLSPEAPALSEEVGDSIHDLSDAFAEADGTNARSPERVLRMLSSYARDRQVRNRVIEAARGTCEYCGRKGFMTLSGRAYLEAHHILALSAAGPDTHNNVIALCAEDHRRAHYGKDWEQMAARMLALVARRTRT
jgi:hypothetical protein